MATRILVIVSAILISVGVSAMADITSLASTGHKGAVSALEFDGKRGLLFSAGEDGTLRIWGADDGSLRGVLAVSRHRMTRIAVNPAYPLLAVIEETGSFSARLSVWDWSRRTPLHVESLDDEPRFLRWSSSGSVLLFGKSSWDSLRMLRTGDWTPIASAVESEGIVGFAELSRNENNLLTYSPVGRIAYWSMADGSTLQESKTVAYLSEVQLTPDRRYLLGATDGELLVTDAVSGDVTARTELTQIRRIDVSPEGDRILCIALAQARPRLSLWVLTDHGLFRGLLPEAVDGADIGAACFGNGFLYAAGPDGTIWAVGAGGGAAALVRDQCPDFTGIDLRGDRLALADAESILVLESDFLGSARADLLPSYITLRSFANPFSTMADLLFLEDGRLLLWKKGADCGPMAILDPDTGAWEAGPSWSGQLVSVKRFGSRILTVEKGGTVRLTDLETQASSIEAWDPGMNAAAFLSQDLFVGGRSSNARGSLVRIDTRTGETVSIPDRNRFVFAVATQPPSKDVFALGVDADGTTGLSVRWGAQLENESLIDRFPAEDLGAVMALDPDGRLFFLLGTERIKVWDGRHLGELAGSGRIPKSLIAAPGLVVALNTDSTLSLWGAQNGEALCHLTVFRDGAWVVALPNGDFLSYRTEEFRVKTLVDGNPVPDNASYRIALPGQAEDPLARPPVR